MKIEDKRRKLYGIRKRIEGGGKYEDVKEDLKKLYIEVKSEMDSLKEFLDEIKDFTLSIKGEKKEDVKVYVNPSAFIQRLRITEVDLTTFIDKGWNAIAKGNYKEAIEILERAKELASENTKILTLLGWAYAQSGRYDDALLIYQKVLTIEPTNTLAMKDMGYICYKKGIYGEAIEHFARVLKLDNNPTATLYTLYYMGLVYLDREMFDDAEEFFKKAIERGPNLQEAYYYLAITYERKGEIFEAKKYLRKTIEINTNTKIAENAMKKLQAYVD